MFRNLRRNHGCYCRDRALIRQQRTKPDFLRCGTRLQNPELQWMNVRRFGTDSVGFRLLLALLMILGTSGASIGGALCATGACPQSCEMHFAKEPAKSVEQSCCPSDAAKPRPHDAGCKCEFTAKTDDSAVAPTVVGVQVPPLLAPPSETPDVTILVSGRMFQPILLHSGISPPSVVRHPDLGRAPPSA